MAGVSQTLTNGNNEVLANEETSHKFFMEYFLSRENLQYHLAAMPIIRSKMSYLIFVSGEKSRNCSQNFVVHNCHNVKIVKTRILLRLGVVVFFSEFQCLFR